MKQMSSPRDSPPLDAAVLCVMLHPLFTRLKRRSVAACCYCAGFELRKFCFKMFNGSEKLSFWTGVPCWSRADSLLGLLPCHAFLRGSLLDSSGLPCQSMPSRGEVRLARSLGWKLAEMVCSQQQKRVSPDASLNAFLNARSMKMLQLVSSSHS